MSETALELNDVAFRWPGPSAFSLFIPNWSVATGDTVLLLGDSGSGKSTLLSLICGTIQPETGSISIDGQNLTRMSAIERDRFRAERIGIIFQQFNLLPFGTVADNIRLPLHFAPERRNRAGNTLNEAKRLCGELGLPSDVLSRKAGDLSVGQQQRVAVARALIGQPPLVIADEPTSALDEKNQSVFIDLLFRQVAANHATLVMVSHDSRLAGRFDKTVQMEDILHLERSGR